MKINLTEHRSVICDYHVTCADIVKQNIAVIIITHLKCTVSQTASEVNIT